MRRQRRSEDAQTDATTVHAFLTAIANQFFKLGDNDAANAALRRVASF